MIKLWIKTSILIVILISVISLLSFTVFATASSNTYVIWNSQETKASCITDGSAPSGYTYYVYAEITSLSTDMYAYSFNCAANGGNTSCTAGPVNVTYPSPIPLVKYSGGWSEGYYPRP